jgi:hypothetical protein
MATPLARTYLVRLCQSLWHVPRLAKWELVDGVHFVVQHIATEVSRIIVNVYKQRALL